MGPHKTLFQIKPLKVQIYNSDRSRAAGALTYLLSVPSTPDSHSHPVQKLLRRLAVDGDGHPGISIKGELQAVEDAGLLAVLGGAVSTIFVPARKAEGQVAGHRSSLQEHASPAEHALSPEGSLSQLPGCVPPF